MRERERKRKNRRKQSGHQKDSRLYKTFWRFNKSENLKINQQGEF